MVGFDASMTKKLQDQTVILMDCIICQEYLIAPYTKSR